MKFRDYDDKTFVVKKLKPVKVKDLNPNTLRMKTYKRTDYIKTDVPLERRSLKNIPRYSDKKPKVHFKDWMGIKGQSLGGDSTVHSYGKAEADGKWYGWSHRAIYGFGVGDTVKAGTIGNDHENAKDFVIKTDDQAKDMAIAFAKDVS
jgi:hypothetical protein